MPWSDIASLGAALLVVWVPGIPLALLTLRRLRPEPAVTLVVAAGLGLSLWMVVGIPAVHHGVFTRRFMVAAVLALGALAWIPARRLVTMLRPGRPGPLTAWLALLTVPAVWLRDDPIYFAYQVADFGEYVNRGNVIADGGPFGGWFVNGFPLLMAESHLLFGEAGTVRIMPFVGLLLAAGVLATIHLAGPRSSPAAVRVAVGVTALPLALHVHGVWFSQFPASETLYAALLVLTMLFAVCALRADDRSAAVVAGSVGFLLVLTRGNGLVYLPVVAVGLAGVPVFVDAARARTVRWYLGSLGGALWIGSLYDSRFNPTYFLDKQAAPRLPGPVADLFVRLDEPLVALGFTAVVAVGLGAATSVGLGAERIRRSPALLAWSRRAAMGVVALGILGAHLFVITPASYLPRYEALGVFVWVGAPAALAVWMWGRIDDDVARFAVGWPLLTGVTMATFQATRVKKSMTVDAPWFLYWDRYFFSEAFPMVLLAGGLAAAVVLAHAAGGDATRSKGSAGHSRGSAARSWTAAVAVVTAVAAVGVVDMIGPTRHATERAMFDDTYDELAAIDALLPEPIPVVYDGLGARPEGWFWSNSSRVLGEPLDQTFEHRMLNLVGALQADPRPDTAEIVELVEGAGAVDAYVVQVSDRPEWPAVDATMVGVSVVGTLELTLERLEGRSAVRPEHQRWIDTVLHVRVLRIATDGGSRA